MTKLFRANLHGVADRKFFFLELRKFMPILTNFLLPHDLDSLVVFDSHLRRRKLQFTPLLRSKLYSNGKELYEYAYIY